MRNAIKNSIKENMHALQECIFMGYANELRMKYFDQTIRNGAVFISNVRKFAQLGFIELVDARTGIPEGIRSLSFAQSNARRHQPIWIPGPNFPNDSYGHL